MSDEPASEAPQHEGLYPIRTVSALTGVNAVTLRAWERRYGLIRPQRTPKGHRLYTEADIERIHRVLGLLEQGIPIGQSRRLLDSSATNGHSPSIRLESEEPWAAHRRNATEAISRFDDAALEAAYNEALAVHPVSQVHRNLVLPVARELRERRAETAVGVIESRFFDAFMRNKLGAQLHHHPEIPRGPKLLVAGLPGGTGEIDTLLFCLAAIRQGYRVAQLGADTPLEPLPAAAQRAQARAIVLFGDREDAAGLGDALRSLMVENRTPVFVGGRVAERFRDAIDSAGAVPLPSDGAQALGRIYERLAR